MDNITRVSEKLKNGEFTNSPHDAAEDLAILAGEYAWIMGQLERVLQFKPAIWSEMRKNFKSDTACERAWQATKAGIDELGLKLRAKACEKMMSALKSLISLAEKESGNLL